MISTKRITLLALLLGMSFSACDSKQNNERPQLDADSLSVRQLPIINGKRVTGYDRLATVALAFEVYGGYSVFCTGTLITPNYVLTAGHCISYCKGDQTNIEENRPYMRVAIGQSETSFTNAYEIAAFYPHPNFTCSSYNIANDIAILKLKKPVPLSVAQPILPLPPKYALTPAEIDSPQGIEATSVGFGKTRPNDDNSAGTKYETTRRIYAVCAKNSKSSKNCGSGYASYASSPGFIFFYSTTTNTCQGDSGGPSFVVRDGHEFVAGVTSYGYEGCNGYDAVTNVSDFYDFIAEHVTDLASGDPEDCFNGIDDNGDGLVDCDDPYCYVQKQCVPEDCSNRRDDNENGLTDCEDPQCAQELSCQPEICDDGIDNNGNGLVDCEEGSCFVQQICIPENCEDHIDNNGNGLTDCDDPQCASFLGCQPEICDDNKDNNGNGLIDCDDPECMSLLSCQPEICNDNVDNNGNGLIDCQELSCKSSVYCRQENCSNGVDDNANGLTDCADPQCASNILCQPEICDDGIDNNANGLIDCDEESCADACAVTPSSSSGCAISSPKSSPFAALLMMLASFACFSRLRRRAH